jgi:hypothetical protein
VVDITEDELPAINPLNQWPADARHEVQTIVDDTGAAVSSVKEPRVDHLFQFLGKDEERTARLKRC